MHAAGGKPDRPAPMDPGPAAEAEWGGDAALVAAIGRRDEAALAALYDRYGRLAFALAYRLLADRGSAEDVVQDAFLAVWRHAERYRPERGAPRAWLMTIVHHAAIDRRRGRHKRELGDVPLDDVAFALEADERDAFEAVAEGIEAERVRRALGELPPEQREAIELAYFGGLTHQEIAERTGAPLGTIKGRMRLGLGKLRARLLDRDDAAAPAPDAGGTAPAGSP
jgi:RNA polymerase sigma-70 factor, ECF subfamily